MNRKYPLDYMNYLQYKMILETLEKEKLSIKELNGRIKIPQSTLYKKIKTLLNIQKIKITQYRLINHRMRKEVVYEVVR